MSSSETTQPKISVVILNYNGRRWLPRCFESLERQTIFQDLEIIVVDNASSDGSDVLAGEWAQRIGRGRLVKNNTNLFFCEGNNTGATVATGEFLLFLNFDLWLETDCLEKLYREVKQAGADAATPLVLNYEDDSFQNAGGSGLDLFGLAPSQEPCSQTTELFAACGCSLLVRTAMFRKIGGFPPEFLMYAEETDVCWRVWIAGGRVVTVPAARLHHRGAAVVNPEGQTKIVESRTSETKRYFANRNSILMVMKNAQHILLLLLLSQFALLFVESIVALALVRRWSYVRKSYFGAMKDAIGMMSQVRQWRARIKGFRRRGDFWMLRFIRLRPGRLEDLKRLFAFGMPKVDVK
jgi:GT2 family glycosyltransferase